MKNHFTTLASLKLASLLLLIQLLLMLSCNGPSGTNRNDMMDGDDRVQVKQDQDSVNAVINNNGGKSLDTLHE